MDSAKMMFPNLRSDFMVREYNLYRKNKSSRKISGRKKNQAAERAPPVDMPESSNERIYLACRIQHAKSWIKTAFFLRMMLPPALASPFEERL